MVSVRTRVAATKATPKTIDRAVRARRSRWARKPAMVAFHTGLLQALHAVEDRIGRGPGHLVHHPAVAEEHHPVGVRRGPRVVGHHHDRLAELVYGLAKEAQKFGAGPGVKIPGGFVREHDFG